MRAASTTRPPSGGSVAVRWSLVAVLGRQASQLVAALVVARLLGPDAFGVISAATVYVTLSTLVLDQGLAAALVQRASLDARAPGAVASLNLAMGVVLAAATWGLSGPISAFFHEPALGDLLRVLGVGLMLKAVAITPRAMLMRGLRFRAIAVADVAGGAIGAIAAVIAASWGAGAWALAWQVLTTDALIAVLMVAAARVRPNLAVAQVRVVLPFGLRILGVNSLAYASRNADNILVGHYLGVTSLSYYAMAYRVLVVPVQLIGQTVNRVVFPTFSRFADDRDRVARNLIRAVSMLAMVAVPPMVFAAVAAPQLVEVVLGEAWGPAAPILTVLAIAGARETVFYVTGSLMKALGAARLNLRYELLATLVQVGGIVVGLRYGVLGVAIGYTVAGFVLSPILLAIQRRLTGATLRQQLGAVAPALSGSALAAAAYLGLRLLDWSAAVTLAAGLAAFAVVFVSTVWVLHRRAARETLAFGAEVLGRRA